MTRTTVGPGSLGAAARRAERFLALHHRRRPLVLPNAWDVASARLFEEVGFPAVATSSAGVAVARGYVDGESMPRAELIEIVGRIAARLRVPVSADLVAGYGRTPRAVATTVRAAVRAGAVGINLEDRDPDRAGLRSVAHQVAAIRAARRAGEALGVPLVINGRSDAFRLAPGDERARLRTTVARLAAYRAAGADCVYPMGVTDAASIETVVAAVDAPVNVMVRRGLPNVAALGRIGVRRISFGPTASYAALGFLRDASREVLRRGSYARLLASAISFDELNRLAERA